MATQLLLLHIIPVLPPPVESYRETPKDSKRIEHDTLSPGAESKSEAIPIATPTFSPDPESIPDSDSASVSSIKRSKRPPDLDLSPPENSTVLAPKKQQDLAVKATNRGSVEVGAQLEQSSQGDFDPTRSSTPTKHSGSISERVSLVNKNPCTFFFSSTIVMLRTYVFAVQSIDHT